MLKETKQTHQTQRCYLNPALRNTTRKHREERLKAVPRAAAAGWAPASPQSPTTLGEGNSQCLASKVGRAGLPSCWGKRLQEPRATTYIEFKFWTRKQNPYTEKPQTKTHSTLKNWPFHCTVKRKGKGRSTSFSLEPWNWSGTLKPQKNICCKASQKLRKKFYENKK